MLSLQKLIAQNKRNQQACFSVTALVEFKSRTVGGGKPKKSVFRGIKQLWPHVSYARSGSLWSLLTGLLDDMWECSWSLSQVPNLDIIPMAGSHYMTQCD